MNEEQIKSLIKQLKAQGLSDEEIMDVFYQTFVEGEMDRKDLEVLAEAMGYELTDDFKNDPNPDPINADGVEGMSKEALEDAKEIGPNESPEEFKEKLDDADVDLGEEGKVEESEEKSEESEPAEEGEKEEETEEKSEESEDEDWEKAQKMFKI